MSLSSLGSSKNLKVEASGGSLSKMLGKNYFIDGENMLKLLSPGANRSSKSRKQQDEKMLQYSRASSPQKTHKKQKSDDNRDSKDLKKISTRQRKAA